MKKVLQVREKFDFGNPRGSGTNLSGGTVPVNGGIVLSMLKMDAILKVDTENLAALPALAQVKPTTVLEDATVPRSKITEMLLCLEEIGAKYNLTIGTFGHAGENYQMHEMR